MLRKRIRLSRRLNRKTFRRQAKKVHKRNLYIRHPRGGIRM